MNPTRLFVLGALARHGPMYGHQIRRDARVDRTELWSVVKPGSLYSALHRLQAAGLIEPVRTEQRGNLPARTVYTITAEGRRELQALRAEALREVMVRPDPVDLALAMSTDLSEDALRGYFAARREALASRAASFARARRRAWPGQTPAEDLIIEHAIARIETELRWHDRVLEGIGTLTARAGPAAGPGPGDAAPAHAAARPAAGLAAAGAARAGPASVGAPGARPAAITGDGGTRPAAATRSGSGPGSAATGAGTRRR